MVEEALQVAVDSGGQRVQSDIKFAALVEQRLLAVLLDDIGALLAVDLVVANDLSDLRQLLAHSDPAASIRVLARLHDPDLSAHHRILNQVLVVLRGAERLLEFSKLGVR